MRRYCHGPLLEAGKKETASVGEIPRPSIQERPGGDRYMEMETSQKPNVSHRLPSKPRNASPLGKDCGETMIFCPAEPHKTGLPGRFGGVRAEPGPGLICGAGRRSSKP
jgi:hypothetical protein